VAFKRLGATARFDSAKLLCHPLAGARLPMGAGTDIWDTEGISSQAL